MDKSLKEGENCLSWLVTKHTNNGFVRVAQLFTHIIQQYQIRIYKNPAITTDQFCFKQTDLDILFEKFALQLPILIFIENALKSDHEIEISFDLVTIIPQNSSLNDLNQTVYKVFQEKIPNLKKKTRKSIWNNSISLMTKLQIKTEEIIAYFLKIHTYLII